MDETEFFNGIKGKGKIDTSKISIVSKAGEWYWNGYSCSYPSKRGDVWYAANIYSNTGLTLDHKCGAGEYYEIRGCTNNPPQSSACIALCSGNVKGSIPDDIANTALAALPYVPPDYNLALRSGWNLISLPLQPENTSIDVVLAPILSVFKTAWLQWEDTFTSYDGPNGAMDDLTTMEFGKGYFIDLASDATLPLYGTLKTKFDPIPIKPKSVTEAGWYYIGAPYNGVVIEDLIAPSLVYGTDIGILKFTEPWKTILLDKTSRLETGVGYYLFTTVYTYFAAWPDITNLKINSKEVSNGGTISLPPGTYHLKPIIKNNSSKTGNIEIEVLDLPTSTTFMPKTTFIIPADDISYECDMGEFEVKGNKALLIHGKYASIV